MNLSKFGRKFTADSGILELMDDLGKAMSEISLNPSTKVNMLGGGNPAHIPELQNVLRQRMQNILNSEGEFENMISNYDSPNGNTKFIKSFVDFINKKYSWGISNENVAITSGSQSGFFILFNLLAGDQPNGTHKKVLLPVVPEYIGYADQGLSEDFFIGLKPIIEEIDNHTFKYKIDFKLLETTLKERSDEIALIILSRPTNPSGNVITDEELAKLDKLAKEYNIPLSIDNAYGEPFPNVIFEDVNLNWNDNMILSFSLSKIGLPSSRTGIFIANNEIISAISKVNAILALANGSYGQYIMQPILESGEIENYAANIVFPYYKEKRDYMLETIKNKFDDNIPYFVHKSEGSFFVWFWFKNLPISSKELYGRLKERNTIVVPGEYFFPGISAYKHKIGEWNHTKECIRVNYGRPKHEVDEGIKILAEEVYKIYNN